MKKIIIKILKKVIRIEHTIYCITGCKVELYLHKSYYEYRRKRYEEYINNNIMPRYDW